MNYAIILAAGRGKRMQSKQDKLLMTAGGHPLIYYSLMSFNDHPEIANIILVVSKNNKSSIENIIKKYHFSKIKKVITGGETRQESFVKGFDSLPKNLDKNDVIITHNAGNPLVTFEEISEIITQAQEHDACIVGHYLTSTIKEINEIHIVKTHDRDKFFAAETPQAAKHGMFKKALENATKKHLEVTDEAMLIEAIGKNPAYIEASENNFKITTQADFSRLHTIMGDLPDDFRIGLGQDSHMFEDAKNQPAQQSKEALTLAGIKIPDQPKLKANSDGDVILHAIFNALSQAIGDMSLGFYADEACEKGIKDSKKYLEIILKKVRQQKLKINSLGLMIECKNPKIDPLVPKLKKSLSEILGIMPARIGITATTGENLTVCGAGMGIQCFAIVSLIK